MPAGFDAPKDLPPETPKLGRILYAWLFFAVACLFLVSIGLEKAQLIPGGVIGTCRAFHLCGPPPLKPLAPLAVPMQPPGSSFRSASRTTLEKYQQENPDYEITFHPGGEYGSCDGQMIKVDCQYHYDGTFSGMPKWHGLLERLGL
jgi:hypothetical protein